MSDKRPLLATLLILSIVFFLANSANLQADPSEPLFVSETGAHMSEELTISQLENEQYLPSVAYNWKHDEYLVVWHNKWGGGGRDVYARRLNGKGELLSWFAVSAGANDRAQPSVAYDPDRDRYLVVWIYDIWGDGSDWDIRGKFVPWQGPPEPAEFTICNWNSSQWNPVVVYNEHPNWPEFFAVWTNTTAGVPAYISGRRLPADGSTIQPDQSDVTISHATDQRLHPDITYNLARNEYLVVYDDTVDILATRLRADGTKLGAGEFDIAGWPDEEIHPSVAACPTIDRYLVAWQSFVFGTDYDIYARFVKGDGTMDGAPLHVAERTANEQETDVACNPRAREFLVVFEEQYSNLTGPYGVTARQISAQKTMGPLVGIVGPYTATNRTRPVVASGYPGYLVVWEHDRLGTAYQDIHGRLYWSHGTYLPLITN